MYFTGSVFIILVLIILFAVYATYANSQAMKRLHNTINSLDNFEITEYDVFNQRNAIAIDKKDQKICIYPNRPISIIIPFKDITKIELYRNDSHICQASPEQPLNAHKLNKILESLSEKENNNKKVKSISIRLETNVPNNKNIEVFMLNHFRGFKEGTVITDLYEKAIKYFTAINEEFGKN